MSQYFVSGESMQDVIFEPHFSGWRAAARSLLNHDVPPSIVRWVARGESLLLFGSSEDGPATSLSRPENATDFPAAAEAGPPTDVIAVPRAFLSTCTSVACHRDSRNWGLMYRVLWRLTHGEPALLDITVDDDVHELLMMHKAVRRDRHKMTAFVRFRRVEADDGERYIAWHRPDHRIVRLTAPFFAERFASLRWTILTSDESVSWENGRLRYSAGVPRTSAPAADELETLWKTYYGSIFNPARVNLKMMRQEMPARHWNTLPETQIIGDLLDEAPRRVAEMVARTRAAAERAPIGSRPDARPTSLPQLHKAIATCQACDLYCRATQAVCGDGPSNARLVIVGEQPGDEEDRSGRPFVGPAGRLLDVLLGEAGIDRAGVYLTNAVKHFKWEPRGKRRLHKTASAREQVACAPWLAAEMELIRPQRLICLGATAARAVMGRDFQLTRQRGIPRPSTHCAWTIATWHPSALLRALDPERAAAMRRQVVDDLRQAASHGKEKLD